jgi:hypothetical protein
VTGSWRCERSLGWQMLRRINRSRSGQINHQAPYWFLGEQPSDGPEGWACMDATPQEIFERHVTALTTGDLDSLAADYREDAVVLTPTGEYRGRAAIRELFAGLSQALPHVTLEAQLTAFADDLLLLHWTADSALNSIPDGVDTFIFSGGAIQAQTISCTLTPKA